MEGILELRDLADTIRSSRRARGDVGLGGPGSRRSAKQGATGQLQRFGNDVKLAFAGFTRGIREDMLVVCDAYGIQYDDQVSAEATHVVLPLAREDLRYVNLEAYRDRVLPSRVAGGGALVVTIDFLFDLVGAIQKFDEVLERQRTAYAVRGLGGVNWGGQGDEGGLDAGGLDAGGLGAGGSRERGSAGYSKEPEEERPGVCSSWAEQYSVGSLKVFGNEFYGAPSLGEEDVLTQVEEIENTDEEEGMGGETNDENADANVETPCTTPGNDHLEIDLKNFAAISSVTPIGLGEDIYDVEDEVGVGHVEGTQAGRGGDAGDDEGDDEGEEVVTLEMRALALKDEETTTQATSTEITTSILQEDIIPGDLLLRAPRNSKVRRRHAIPAGREMVVYTDSVTLRLDNGDMIDIDVKSTKNVALKCGMLMLKPLFFYKIRGESWRVEYRRLYSMKDIPASKLGPPADLDPAELYLSTAVEGASLCSLTGVKKVFVDKLSGVGGRRPVLRMEMAGNGEPAWFYRYEYDVETNEVLYKQRP